MPVAWHRRCTMPRAMNTGLMLATTFVALVIVIVAIVTTTELVRHSSGRFLLLVAAVLLPLAVSGGGVLAGVKRSSETQFCISCHEMEPYGRSLFVDNPESLPAAHYQQRLITREQTCYACHTDYAMFGDVKAKLNGLKHVWVHYVTGAPDKIELYQPYPNYNCLHCHDDARGFLEVSEHRKDPAALQSGEVSCLSCHDVGHDLEGAAKGPFWQAAEKP